MPELPEQPEQLDARSHDIVRDKIAELLELFPEVRTEDGQIDFDRLKLALGESVDVGKERYGLTWPGKADCFKTIQAPSLGTLLPAPNESVNWDNTENLIIEGDNLEVLKLLQKSYLGSVKMIYIDPPYNTGNDFIYPDDYSESLKTYLEYTGQVDAEGRRFSTNTDTDGRFHSKWLNMMYPRLYLARNLLSEDGLIFISIDDNEVDNLKKLCNEVFGEENFVEQVVWKNKYGSGAMTKGFANVHEYILCYSRSPTTSIMAPLTDETIAEYKSRDDKYPIRGGYVTQPLATKSKDVRPNLRFPIHWNGHEIWPEKQWVWSKERVEQALRNDELTFSVSGDRVSVRAKQYLRDEQGVIRKGKPVSILNGPFNQEGTREVDELLGEGVFSFPKPSALLRYLISFIVNEDESKDFIALDLFAGSGTLGQAVLDLNRQDGGKRRFILVQLPEPTERDDYPTIADIAKERVRRVIDKLNREHEGRLELDNGEWQDCGFRVFKLAESNFRIWKADVPHQMEALIEQLELHVAHVTEDRSSEDLLFEILLKSGYPLTTAVESVEVGGKRVYSVADGALLVCLDRHLTLETVRGMADREPKPDRAVCLDDGFAGDDQLKTNAVQLFKTRDIVFRTA